MSSSSFWKSPIVMLLLIVLAIGAGVWLAMDRPMPDQWWGQGDRRPEIRLPEFMRRDDPDRVYCAESSDTGVCRCITADGERPDVSEEECRRRARESQTRVEE